jgi:hypothetical protein
MDLSFDNMKNLGVMLRGRFDQYEKDRQPVETQWVKNLRQYLRQYDPEVLACIPPERSHVYPGDTRVKVKGKVAKMMEMMFPSQENNWELSVSPIPSIPEENLKEIIAGLEQEEVAKAQQEQRPPDLVTSEQIERAVKVFAEQRKNAMQDEIADQLADKKTDYPHLAKRVVRSGTIYGCGVARSPQVRNLEERIWEKNKVTGVYEAVTKTLKRPYPEYVRMWNLYPDLSALSWDEQEGLFERVVLTRHDFKALAKRDDFRGEVIKEYLKNNTAGNYKTRTYETELHAVTDTTNLIERNRRRYEAFRWFGFVSAHDLQAAGILVKDSELHEDVLADVWLVDNIVIKAEVAPFGELPSDMYHAYIPSEDEDAGLTGVGLPEDVRDSQMSICASTRALMDNMAATAGPIFEYNTDLLPQGRKTIDAIHSFMAIAREGQGVEASAPAVRAIFVPNHTTEIMNIAKMNRDQLDVESNLPAFLTGGMQQPLGEAFRTSSNMSMMMGGANMVTKDDVRAFDRFTTSLIGSFLSWNMEFNEREELKGDFQVRAKGNLSLVSKEVRGAALDQFMQTLDPEEKAMLNKYGILIDRLKARDLPIDRVLPEKEAMAIIEGMRKAQSEASGIESGLTQAKTAKTQADAQKSTAQAQNIAAAADATLKEILSRVEANMANAKSATDRTQLENFKVMLEQASETPPAQAAA